MDTRDRVRAVLMGVVALALGGMLINSMFEEDLDPADYPKCSEIVEYPGSDPEALCVTGGDVIPLETYSLYEFYR